MSIFVTLHIYTKIGITDPGLNLPRFRLDVLRLEGAGDNLEKDEAQDDIAAPKLLRTLTRAASRYSVFVT